MQPLLGGAILGEDDHALHRPRATWLDRAVQPLHEFGCFVIGTAASPCGPLAHPCEQPLFFARPVTEERRSSLQGNAVAFFPSFVVAGFFLALLYLAAHDPHCSLD